MTVYDDPHATDGEGGPHPLAGVPQEVLDAAVKELDECLEFFGVSWDTDTLEEVGHSVILAAVNAAEKLKREGL